MRTHCINNSVDVISMPRIASGRDKMEWEEIHEMLNKLFKSSYIEIRIYTFDEEKISQDWGEPGESNILQSIHL